MDPITILLWLFGQLVVGAAIWGGIRADVKSIHLRLDSLHEQIIAANARMDRHLEVNWLHMRMPE